MSKEEIIELVEYLSDKLSDPAEKVFELAVRNAMSGAIIWLLFGLSFLIVGVWMIRRGLREDIDEFDAPWLAIPGICFAALGLLIVAINVHSLINIEFTALRSLIPNA